MERGSSRVRITIEVDLELLMSRGVHTVLGEIEMLRPDGSLAGESFVSGAGVVFSPSVFGSWELIES